jgi:hypothetical protein
MPPISERTKCDNTSSLSSVGSGFQPWKEVGGSAADEDTPSVSKVFVIIQFGESTLGFLLG